MILVAFVLVLVATVMLIIGTFFDAGTAYIWISIIACLATFVVLAISYYARRRGQETDTARPAPLAGDASRTAATARASTVGGGGTATMVRDRTEVEADEDDEPTVTIVRDEAPAAVADDAPADPDETTEIATPAPRKVAPRRVVRRPAAAAPAAEADTGTDEGITEEAAPAAAPAQPRIVATGRPPATPEPEVTPEPEPEPAADAEDAPEAEEAAPAAAAAAPAATRKVVRRVAPSGDGTRKVVRRAAPSGEGTRKVVRRTTAGTTRVVRPAGSGQPTRVVRRTAGGDAPRTVKRVVRSAGETSAPAAAEKPASNRTGTRGKRARAVLSEIKGVGPAKQDALLKKFGSLENMAEASVQDLAEIKGVGEAVATEIKRVLQAR